MTQQAKRPEGIRAWYSRTTSKARKALLWFSVIGTVAAIVVFAYVPTSVTERIQQFNGAMTIPLFGLIWIVGFIYMFLIPQREAGFRSQEWVEDMVVNMKRAIDVQVAPAVEIWQKIGRDVQAELPGFIADAKAAMKDLRESAKKLNEAIEKNEKIAQDVKPVLDSLRRIEAKIETEINRGLFEKVDTALESVRGISGIPAEEQQEPDPAWALESIRRNKLKSETKA